MDSNSVEKIIQNVIKKIDENPFSIHREADIQAMIYNELCNKYDRLYPILLKDENNKKYKTNLVHCEYYFGEDNTHRHKGKTFDVVIFNENDVENINSNWLAIANEKNKNKWNIVRLKDIIEIKVEFGLSGKKFLDFDKSREKEDIDKLLDFKQLHYDNKDLYLHFICFLRLEKKSKEKYDKIIESFFKKMDKYCENENVRLYSNKNCFVNVG